MLRSVILSVLTVCTLSNAQAQMNNYPPQPHLPRFPESAHPENEGLYKAMQAVAVGMEIAGPTLIFAGVKADFDNSLKGSWFDNGQSRVNSTPLYVSGASLVMVGIVLNVFANAKLYPHGMKAEGNSISLAIPRTNKHFGM